MFSAGACGAGHRRARIFILGWSAEDVADGEDDHRRSGERHQEAGTGPDGQRRRRPSGSSESLADSDRERPEYKLTKERESGQAERQMLGRHGKKLADSDGGGLKSDSIGWLLDGEREARRNDAHGLESGVGNAWGKRLQGLESTGPTPGTTGRAGIPPFPPGPADADTWRAVLERWPELAPAQPELRGVAHGMAHRVDRVDRLRTTGNGVLPLVAARALVTLARRAGIA